MKNLKWLVWALIFLSIDQGTKCLAIEHLNHYQSVAVFPGFNWTLVFNSGSAFGFLSQSGRWHHYVFTLFGLLMTVVLTIWIGFFASKDKWELLGLSLILSGAVGNVIDRLRLGSVIDFIDLYYKNYHWPVFNIADCAICIGAVILFFAQPYTRSNRKIRQT